MSSKLGLLLCLSFIFILVIPVGAAYETGGVTKTILSNGMTVLVRPEPEAKVVAIEIFAGIGAEDETAENAGIGQLLASSILAGTETRSPMKLARLVSQVGGNFHAAWQWNYLEVYAVTLPDMCDEALDLLADSIQNSKLDPAAVQFSKSAILKEAQRQDADQFNRAYVTLRRRVQRGTCYDRPFLGDADKVQKISQKELKDFYEQAFSADRMVISVVGNVNPQRVTRKIETIFGNFQCYPKHAVSESFASPVTGTLALQSNAPISFLMLGYPAPGVDDPDYHAMCVANTLLGGNKSSLLFTKLREEKGLGYQLGSLYPTLRGSSHVALFVGMDSSRATPEVMEAAKTTMLEQVEVLRSGGFSDDDLERAKRYLIGYHALQHERTHDRAFYLGWHEVMGLGYQTDFLYDTKVKAVTRADVERVCKSFFTETSVVTLSGGKPSAEGQ